MLGSESRRWAVWSLRALPMVAVFVVFVVSGMRGVNFGVHWDEVEAQMKPVRDMISTGILVPSASGYPSLSKFATLQATLPAGIKTWVKTKGNPHAVQAAMLAKFDEPGFILTVRRLYVVISAFTIVWVWAAVLALRRPWWEATAAAAAVGLCWEFAYHARWVATDCPLVQFSALTLLMFALYFRTRHPPWLYAAAVTAGLATGTKYQGIVLLVPLVLAGALTLPLRPLRHQIFRAAALAAVAFAAFLVTTPNLLYATVRHRRRVSAHSQVLRDRSLGVLGQRRVATCQAGADLLIGIVFLTLYSGRGGAVRQHPGRRGVLGAQRSSPGRRAGLPPGRAAGDVLQPVPGRDRSQLSSHYPVLEPIRGPGVIGDRRAVAAAMASVRPRGRGGRRVRGERSLADLCR